MDRLEMGARCPESMLVSAPGWGSATTSSASPAGLSLCDMPMSESSREFVRCMPGFSRRRTPFWLPFRICFMEVEAHVNTPDRPPESADSRRPLGLGLGEMAMAVSMLGYALMLLVSDPIADDSCMTQKR